MISFVNGYLPGLRTGVPGYAESWTLSMAAHRFLSGYMCDSGRFVATGGSGGPSEMVDSQQDTSESDPPSMFGPGLPVSPAGY